MMEANLSEESLRYYKWLLSGRRKRLRGLDRISKLPESLICQMLLFHLPTKDVVKTSLLSKRWKNLWLQVPVLDLDANEFPDYNAFVTFVDKFLDSSRDSYFHKLKLSIRRDVNDQACVMQWIDSVVKRKLRSLDVECHVMRECLEVMPLSLYVCETLVYLRLHRVSMGDFASVSFPCLKTLRSEHNVYTNDAAIELLISSCPVLQDLSIARRLDDNVKVLTIRSQTLTSLSVEFYPWEDGYEREADDVDFEHEGSGILIDAPRLEYLNFEDDMTQSKIIRSSGSLAKVNLVGVFNLDDCFDIIGKRRRNMIRSFFASVSGVKDMLISEHTAEYLYYNTTIEPLPQFCNLSSLEVSFNLSYLEMLPRLLESFPNLKSFVIVVKDMYRIKESDHLTLSAVPRCLVSSLEFVEIQNGFCGSQVEIEVVRYFVENSVVLKKLVLHLTRAMLEKGCRVFMDLLAFPRRSSNCQILFPDC